MSDNIILRVWTNMGKENIYHVDYFREHSSTIEIRSNDMDSILRTVTSGEPCTLSFLTYTSKHKSNPYTEHQYRGCTVMNGSIHYMALCVPSD